MTAAVVRDSMSPAVPRLFAATWRRGLFAHWPFDPERLRAHVPAPLALDTYDGTAWVGVLPFRMANVRLRSLPKSVGVSFPELNVRTYVSLDGTPGVYFFSLDVGNRLMAPLARLATGLPYRAAAMHIETHGGQVEFESVHRGESEPTARFRATYGPTGDAFRAAAGSLDRWLTDRRRLYAPRGDRIHYGEVHHGPWPLQDATATIHENTLFAALDLPSPDGEPRYLYCERLDMEPTVVRRLRGPDPLVDVSPH